MNRAPGEMSVRSSSSYYSSWEHCYGYFHRPFREFIAEGRDNAAVELGFYLASWGSSFLLQHAYTVHLGVIDCILAPRFSVLWNREFGLADDDLKLVPTVLES